MSEAQSVSIATLLEGAIIEVVDQALDEAWQNIVDPDTESAKKRTVQLKIELMPDSNREAVDLVFHVSAKLAPPRPLGTKVGLVLTEGGPTAVEYVSPQLTIHDAVNTEFPRIVGGGKEKKS